MSDASLVLALRRTTPANSGYAENANKAADLIERLERELALAINERDTARQQRADWKAAHEQAVERASVPSMSSEQKALDLLRQLEWAGHNGYCPACDGWQPSNGGSGPRRHSETCPLAALLASRNSPGNLEGR